MIQNLQELRQYAGNNGNIESLIVSDELKNIINQVNQNIAFWTRNPNCQQIYDFTFDDANVFANFKQVWIKAGFSEQFCQFLFYSKQRPKINLNILCTKLGIDNREIDVSTKTILDDSILTEIKKIPQIILPNSQSYLIPVLRYEFANPKVYFEDIPYTYKPNIPTFYYLESQSPWYLGCNTITYAQNKLQLCKKLGASLAQIRSILVEKLLSHLDLTDIDQMIDMLSCPDEMIPPHGNMSLEHVLDDLVTALLRAHKIEVAILGQMEQLGQYQVEIIDVRSRLESFGNLYVSENFKKQSAQLSK